MFTILYFAIHSRTHFLIHARICSLTTYPLNSITLCTYIHTYAPPRFKQIPPLCGIAMRMELIPISVKVTVFVEVVKMSILNLVLFKWAMEKIVKEIFNVMQKKHDNTPPVFERGCVIYQADSRDRTDPGIMLEYEAKDKESKVVKGFMFVGSSPNAQDLIVSICLIRYRC